MKHKLVNALKEFDTLLKCAPALLLTSLVMSIFSMNLLANKSVDVGIPYLALDCGILLSWVIFLSMDIATKHFGARAATELAIFALVINLGFCLVFYAASAINGAWGESFSENGEAINTALDNTFGGTWYVVLGSSIAFTVSAFVNNFSNAAIGKLFKANPDSPVAYGCRTYLSTAIGQLVDNLVFAFLVSRIFFGWTTLQCVMCSVFGMVAELLFEVVFSPIGYAVCKRMKRDGVGAEYFELVKANGGTL